METTRGNLTVKKENLNIEITNGCVMVRLIMRDGGYCEEYYAVDRSGQMQLILSSLHKNMIPSSDHRACASPMISGDQSHIFAVCRESLRMVYSSAKIEKHNDSQIVVLLSGSAMGHNLTCRICLNDGEKSLKICVEDSIDRSTRPPLVEYLMSSYAFMPAKWAVTVGNDIDYTFTPILRPGDDQIIGDCAFYSPAAVIQHSSFAAALIPDLFIHDERMANALDLDAENGLLSAPIISYGFCGYEENEGHCYHDVTMSKRLDPPHLKYAFDLFLDANCPKKSIHKRVARILWERHGSRKTVSSDLVNIRNQKPESRDGNILSCALQEPDAWAALGVHYQGNRQLEKGAKAVINALLDVPKFDGLFPTRFDHTKRAWTNSNPSINGAYYNTSECSRQCCWMLDWYKLVDDDERILDFCKEYADFLVDHTPQKGNIAPWFDRQGRPLQALNLSSQASESALFLARLGAITGIEKYIGASAKLLKSILKTRVFQDQTLIDINRRLSVHIRDPHTGAPPLSAWSLLLAAMSCMELYESTCDRKLIDQGTSIFDQLCLFQSIGGSSSELISRGMLANNNTGICPDIELTALFAWCAMRYADITGISEYFSRGNAALKAALHACTNNPLSSAHVAAIQEIINKSYGNAYVHVSKRWAVPINGARIQNISFNQGGISICITNENHCPERIVFGGMRGKTYKLNINKLEIIASSDQMKSGININRH